MAKHKVLDERTLEVLWVIARNGHATGKVIMVTLRQHGMPMRNRYELGRCLEKLQHQKLVTYEHEFGEYVLNRKNVYARRDKDKQNLGRVIKLWDQIKDQHEWQRSFGSAP